MHDGSVPVNMPDPIRKRFGYGQLWPLRPMCSQNRAGSFMPDPTSRIHFSSVFPKKAWIILRKTDPDPGHGLARHIWSGSKLVCKNHLARFRSSTDVPDHIVQKPPGSDLVLAGCVRFWPNGSGPIRTGCESDPACLLGSVLQ